MADDEVTGPPQDEGITPAAPAGEPGNPDVAATETAPVATQPVLKTRWRDRAWTFRAMMAVAAASLVIGAIGGGVVVAAAGGDHDGHHRMDRWGPGGMPPGWQRHRMRNFDGPGRGPGGPMMPYGNGNGYGNGYGPTPAPTAPPSATPTPSSGATG